jgi:hypothetical protein
VLVVELVFIAVARWKGSAALIFNGWSWAWFSGMIWLVSTSIAFRIVKSWIHAKLAR